VRSTHASRRMAARIDDVLAIDDVDHLKTRTVARRGVHIAGIANRHFTLLMQCQFADGEQLELLPRPGHTGLLLLIDEAARERFRGEQGPGLLRGRHRGGADESCAV